MSAVNRIEVKAKTVEEAVRLALAQLNRRQDEVQIEILREPTGGIFGFGAEDAVVRVTAPAAAFEEDEEDEADIDEDEAYENIEDEEAEYDEYEEEYEEYADEEDEGMVMTAEEAEVIERLDVTAKACLEQLFAHMDVPANVSIRNRDLLYLAEDDPPTTALDVTGRNLGALIGRKGETLASLQYLVNLMVNKQLGQWTRVLVDIEGYRRRREESLEGLAQRVAYRVAQSGRPVTLEPMPPNERRVIHMVLRDHPDVFTESVGEGEARKVTVIPRSRQY